MGLEDYVSFDYVVSQIFASQLPPEIKRLLTQTDLSFEELDKLILENCDSWVIKLLPLIKPEVRKAAYKRLLGDIRALR